MASLNIPEPDVFEIPAKRPLNSPQAASWRSDRMANTGPQTPQGWAPPGGGGEASANKTMRWAQSIQQGAAKFAEGPGPNGITEGAKNLTGSIRDASAGATKTAMNLGAGAAKRIPLGAVLGAASEALPHSGVYTNGDDVPWQDRMRIGATDALAAGGGFLGGAAGAGVGQVALPIPGVGAVAGGLAGGVLGAQAGRWLGNKMFDSDGALQRAGYDPNRSVVDIGTDVASGKPLEEAMAPTMRAPVAPQRPAAPGLPGIGAVKDAQAPAPVSFADGAGGGFGARGRFAPNQVTPTGPGLVGQAPTTFAEGSDRGGLTIGPNPVTSSAPAASSPPTASFPANSDGQPGGTVPGTGVPMPPNPAGTIRRVGNSYEGSNIKFGADIDKPRNPSVGVTSFDTSEGRRQDAMELQRMRATTPSVTTGDGGSTLGQGPIGFGAGAGGTADFGPSLSTLTNSSMKPRDIRHAQDIAVQRATNQANIESATRIASMREGGDMARANLGANVQRENNAATTATQMYGHDIAAQGHVLTNQSNRMRLQAEQFNKNRDFDAGRSDAAFNQKESRDKQLQSNLEAMNPGADNKPDMIAVAEQRQGIERSIARMGAKGTHELSPMDEQRLLAGSEMLKVMKNNAGWLPWNPDKLKTVDPVDLTNLRVLSNGDRQITRKDSKAAGQVIPKRFFDTAEGARFFGGTPTNRYDILHEAKQ